LPKKRKRRDFCLASGLFLRPLRKQRFELRDFFLQRVQTLRSKRSRVQDARFGLLLGTFSKKVN
jgi:hypothetical protein